VYIAEACSSIRNNNTILAFWRSDVMAIQPHKYKPWAVSIPFSE
jgi:hypothetical protein